MRTSNEDGTKKESKIVSGSAFNAEFYSPNLEEDVNAYHKRLKCRSLLYKHWEEIRESLSFKDRVFVEACLFSGALHDQERGHLIYHELATICHKIRD
jgi:hypothetical protein